MAAAQRTTGYQREVAERNVEAILDAAEELLASQGHANISAVAAQAGVSRVTVYAHFPTWTALLEAAVERAVRQTMTALQSVHPEDGPPVEALDRMVENASAMGANAIVMMRFDSGDIGTTMNEVVAYGTAVVIEPA